MEKPIKHVLVVGGGTAGWLTACILAKKLNSINPSSVSVSLVESPNIPILGVGEGTWPTIRGTLKNLDIDETEFMRECDATFKQGSEFVNWRDSPEVVGKHSYYHPLSAVFHSAYDQNLAPYWLLGYAEKGVPYDEAVATQARLCKAGRAPKKITTPAYQAIQNYSYHLNAHKFAAFLTKIGVERLGVKHIRANVNDVQLDELGNIHSVQTDLTPQSSLTADIFIDCTGSRALLIGEALNTPWRRCDHIIFNDTALAMQIPYESAEREIPTHTIATAQSSGWTWDIGLTERRGVGLVFSSQHCSSSEAERILREYVGPASEHLDIRKIPMRVGYRETLWKGNCIAQGMAGAFIEPLEASAIFLTDASAHMIADLFPQNDEAMAYSAKKFNSIFKLRWEKTIDFIKLHYCLSKRQDSAYWRDNSRSETIPDTLREKLEHWRFQTPNKYDFDFAYEPFVLDSYLFVLYGMGFETDLSSHKSRYLEHAAASKKFDEIALLGRKLEAELPMQRELIQKVQKYGFSTI